MKNTNFFAAPTDTNFKFNIKHGDAVKFHIPEGSSVGVNAEMLGLFETSPYIKFTCNKNSESVILESGKSYQPFIINDKLEITPLGDAPMNNIVELD
ncbi:hypothetical protein RAS_10480 [Rickettsia asiatica]|uniref:Uncharacterized protein n=1 Tax=Rickettsia asiatica TaxID=238800 RepID=A0A510GD48_9RICK|nr:hypothetical protein [Rickettsia asiatica]BBJ31939.1 hypothetical protein RAS_10480 [Rickettsia asiatica]